MDHHPALGEMDESEGEFWISNPWLSGGRNLSAYERNGVALNVGEGKFVDLSYFSGADLDSDSRTAVVADFNEDGMPDLLVRSTGGGAVRVFENRMPKKNWLAVRLRGVRSNRFGIGAKLKLEAGGKTLHRELHPQNNYQSQTPCRVHFGMGEAAEVERLTILWPSGAEQVLEKVAINQLLTVEEPQ